MLDFDRSVFYPYKNKFTNKNFKQILKNLLLNEKIENSFLINDISSLENIKKHSILFIKKKQKIPNLNFSNICVITNCQDVFNKIDCSSIHLISDLDLTYNIILNYLFNHEDSIGYSDNFSLINDSYISKYSKIDPSSKIFKNCVIGRGVVIGKNCIIKNNVVIKNSIIGNDVIIADNSTIGSTGFGFSLNNMGASNISPQIGIVHIDDNVSIGSNCTIDRGKIDITYIGKNCMLDNLIHIAHNVILKGNVCIAAQTGISGSTTIGKNVIIGGQSGFAGHIQIGNDVMVAAKSGVTKNIKNNSIIAGFPAVDIKEWKKNIIKLRKYGHK